MIDNFEIIQGKICFMASITNILKYYNVNILEEIIFGMTAGLNIRVKNELREKLFDVCKSDSGYIECIDINRDKNSIDLLLKKYGYELKQPFSNEIDNTLDIIKKSTESFHPVLAVVNMYYLEYHVEYQRVNRGHFIIILGIDYDQEKVLVADNYIASANSSTYIGYVSLDNFKKSLSVNTVENISKQWIYILQGTNEHFSLNKEVVVNKIISDCNCFCKGQYENEFVCGLESIKELKKVLEIMVGEDSSELLNEKLEFLNMSIISLGGTAPSRKLYGLFLKWAKENVGLDVTDEICAKYIELSVKWKVFAMILAKASKSGKYIILERGISKLDEIFEMEKKLSDELKNQL